MLSADPEYRRLRLGGHGAFGSASYWAGKGHLLVVMVSSYVEKYHRFQYRDIQALIIRKTRVHYFWGFAFAALAIGCSLWIFDLLKGRPFANLDNETQVWCWILSALTLVGVSLVIANALLGPTCVCYLRTAVQTTQLPQLRRWKKGAKLIAELSPLVIAAQPSLQAPQVEQSTDSGLDNRKAGPEGPT